MSSCVIIAQKDKLYIGADSACSIKTEYGFKRCHNDMQKLFKFGNQVLFCSGRTIEVHDCIKWINSNMPNNIDIDRLSCYLQKHLECVSCEECFNIEIIIVDYDTKYIYQLSQYNNFKILKYKSTEQLFILCGGYRTSDFFNKIRENIVLNKSVIETYIDTYRSMCDECVGGYITIYSSPNELSKYKIDFFDISNVRVVDNLFLMTSDFVTAGFVSGSQIIGGDIYSDNYSKTNETGSYLNLRDGTFSFAGGALRYEGGKLLISSPDIPTSDTITEINEEYLKTTTVYAENLQVNSANISGTLTADQIDATELKVDIANVTGTITASKLSGNEIGLFNDDGIESGTIKLGDSSSAEYAVQLYSSGAIFISAGNNDEKKGAVWVSGEYVGLSGKIGNSSANNFYPTSGSYTLGTSEFPWNMLYSTSCSCCTSDRLKKKDFDYDLTQYNSFFDSLQPLKFKFVDGSSNRFHTGFISQDVEESLTSNGLTSQDFAGFVKSPNEDGDGYNYMLRYEEFVALNTWQIQRLKERVNELELKLDKILT